MYHGSKARQKREKRLFADLKPTEISHFDQLQIGRMGMMAHIVLDGADILRLVEAGAHQLVDHPLELGHVEVALDLRAHLKLVDLKLAQQEEGEAVWQDVLAVHLAALLLRVVALIDRVVLTQILVERDTDHAVAHNHALVQSRDLRIDAGHTDIRECLLESRESVAETRIQIVDVGILGLHVSNDALQDRVLIELEQL